MEGCGAFGVHDYGAFVGFAPHGGESREEFFAFCQGFFVFPSFAQGYRVVCPTCQGVGVIFALHVAAGGIHSGKYLGGTFNIAEPVEALCYLFLCVEGFEMFRPKVVRRDFLEDRELCAGIPHITCPIQEVSESATDWYGFAAFLPVALLLHSQQRTEFRRRRIQLVLCHERINVLIPGPIGVRVVHARPLLKLRQMGFQLGAGCNHSLTVQPRLSSVAFRRYPWQKYSATFWDSSW